MSRRIKTLILENFQSHTYTELELADTLTVIVGETDQGKSAIVRALQWLFLNEPRGADFIRVGTNECRVTAVFDDGVRLSRERNSSGTKNRYIIEHPGQEPLVLEGFGTTVPQEVIDLTGVRKLWVDDATSLVLHFARQLEAPFLLNETGAVKAKAIGQLTGTHLFDIAHKRVTKDSARLEQEEKRLQEEVKRIDEELQGFTDLPDLEKAIGEVEKVYERLKEVEVLQERLTRLNTAWKQNLEALKQVEETLASLANLPETENTVLRAAYAAEYYQQAQTLADKLQLVNRQLMGADIVAQSTEGLDEAASIIENIQNLSFRAAQLKTLNERWMSTTKGLNTAEQVIKITAGVPAAEKRLERLQAIPATYKALSNLAKSLANNRRQVQEAEKAAQQAASELTKYGETYAELLKKAGQCPVCHAPISPETASRIVRDEVEGVV